MKIQLLVDNKGSWIIPYAKELLTKLQQLGHKVSLIHKHDEVESGDILCLLACEKKFSNLVLNTHNLVVHESDLPRGKGWSPVTWQILEGKNRIPVTLFEATESIDSGVIYDQEYMELTGQELLPEIKHIQGIVTNDLIVRFVNAYPNVSAREQKGEESFYAKRTAKDSALDIQKNLAEQFNMLRVCDNERYPAYFWINKKKYIIKIYSEENE